MTITIQKEKLEHVDEKIILLNVIGCFEAVKNGGITIEEAEKFIFSPRMIERLKGKGYNDKIVELISKGCELEDIASLIPHELEKVLEEMKQEAIEIIKEYEPIDEIPLIDVICGLLCDNQVKFVISDEHCDDFGMDCKFDLPCLLESFDDIMEGLRKKQDFNTEFYEQGRECFFSFIMAENNVKINLKYGGHNEFDTKYETSYTCVKNMFIEFYNSIFQYAAE